MSSGIKALLEVMAARGKKSNTDHAAKRVP